MTPEREEQLKRIADAAERVYQATVAWKPEGMAPLPPFWQGIADKLRKAVK